MKYYLFLILGCKDAAILFLDRHSLEVVRARLEKILGLDVASELHLFELIIRPLVHRYGTHKTIARQRESKITRALIKWFSEEYVFQWVVFFLIECKSHPLRSTSPSIIA
jgi:hypothetical protein